jgi:hypothetical protein
VPKLSAGDGAKGHRFHDWVLVTIRRGDHRACQQLLVRRNRRTGELAF